MNSRIFLLAVLLTAISACSRRERTVTPGTTVDGGRDGSSNNNGSDGGGDAGRDGAPSVNECNPACGPNELCGPENDGNGVDDNCNGQVDEGCVCGAAGLTRQCFAGPPDRRDVGACASGVETCDEFLQWGPCVGGVSPSDEQCDGIDNDCNGETDDGLSSCTSAIHCPESETTRPLSTFTLDGARLYDGTGSNWHWTIECPASVTTCPTPSNANAKMTDVYFVQSGAYRIGASVVPDGESEPLTCAWTVYVAGDGLRIELDWDTMDDGVDIDLHLHQWTRAGVDSDYYADDDCFYGNCTPGDDITWAGHPDTALSNCQDAPRGGGAVWQSEGACRNPRLDIDTNGGAICNPSVTNPESASFCAPENINVDNPILGKPYRIMAHYYEGSNPLGGGSTPTTYPTVNIYCGGALRATFGTDPFVAMRYKETWNVADVVFIQNACGIDCRIYPITGAPRVGNGTNTGPNHGADTSFGPAWSCDYSAADHSCTVH